MGGRGSSEEGEASVDGLTAGSERGLLKCSASLDELRATTRQVLMLQAHSRVLVNTCSLHHAVQEEPPHSCRPLSLEAQARHAANSTEPSMQQALHSTPHARAVVAMQHLVSVGLVARLQLSCEGCEDQPAHQLPGVDGGVHLHTLCVLLSALTVQPSDLPAWCTEVQVQGGRARGSRPA